MTAPTERLIAANRVAKKGRRYTPEQRAAVLAVLKAKGGKVKPTARETGVPAPTIRDWRDDPDNFASTETRAVAERDLATEINEVRWLLLDAARRTAHKERASYAIRGFVELTNAHQLLTGKPTQRIEASPWGQLLKEIRDGRTARLTVLPGGKEVAS